MIRLCNTISRANAYNVNRNKQIIIIQKNLRGYFTRKKFFSAISLACFYSNKFNKMDRLFNIARVSRLKRYTRASIYIAFNNINQEKINEIYQTMRQIDIELSDDNYYLGWQIATPHPRNMSYYINNNIKYNWIYSTYFTDWFYIVNNIILIPYLVYCFALQNNI